MNTLDTQFGHPSGFIGWLVGQAMAIEHRELTQWATGLLELRPDDQVLEVGFGPGTAILRMSQVVTQGLVAGVDLSEIMVKQARGRNAAAIRARRVELRQGSSVALPYEAESFDKALVINSLDHWSSPSAGLKELCRVLKPGGLVAIVERPHEAKTDEAVQQAGQQTMRLLQAAGFGDVKTVLGLKGTTVGMLGTK
ncbi:MAG TPA: class I SAM-dependent methyltransferase [Anaerolineae bacterium]